MRARHPVACAALAAPAAPGAKKDMPPRLRKLVGTIMLVAFVSVYALTAMTVAAAKLPGTSGLVQFAYFAVAGLLWVIPAAALISWMSKPGGGKP
jgi:hypothetical protein